MSEEHLCVAGEHCRDYDRQQQRPALVADTPLCEPCLLLGERAAGQLVLDYRDLEQFLPQFPAQRLDGQPGHTGEASIPLRLDVEALQRTIWWVTTTWAEILGDRHRLAPPNWLHRTRNGWAVNWACTILAPRVGVLAQLPQQQLADYPLDSDGAIRHRQVVVDNISGAQAVLDLAWLHDRARSILGLTKLIRKLPGHCQRIGCGRAELHQENGSDNVWCGHCGHTVTRDDYERYGNVFLQGAA